MSECFYPNGLIRADQYDAVMSGTVQPALAACRTEEIIQGDGSRPIFTVRWPAEEPRCTVLIVHGFTENADKYAELVYSLLQHHCCVLSYDQRGHGRSWRDPAIRDLSLTHVDRFDEYVRDLRCVVERVLRGMPKPWLLMAHSMGGAVAACYLETWQDTFERAALLSPMIAPNRGGIPLTLSKLICSGAHLLGQDKKRLFVSKPYAGPEDFDTSCATDRARFMWYDRIKQAEPLFQNNGPTYAWTRESLRVTDTLLADGAPERIACPVAIWSAAQDTSVLPEPQQRFIARVRDGRIRTVAGSRHEIFRSTDEVLVPWWDEVLAFLTDE